MLRRELLREAIVFERLAQATKPPKSLMRMFSPSGNPNASHLFTVLGYLQKREGIHFDVRTGR